MTDSLDSIDTAAELRAWAKGLLPLEAATEMLIRGGWVKPGSRFVRRADDGRLWIDFAALPDQIGVLSGGEQRYLLIAASIAADVPIVLGDQLSGLDHDRAQIVLSAVAHATGFGTPSTGIEIDGTGTLIRVSKPTLYEWPISSAE